MRTKLASRPDLAEKIIPKDFAVGCRRPTPGNGYLEALVQPNVTTYTEQLQEITEKGFIDSEGVEHEVDVIVCATGFDTTFVPRFPIIANGQNLQDLWAKDACAYLSLMVPKFPYVNPLFKYALKDAVISLYFMALTLPLMVRIYSM